MFHDYVCKARTSAQGVAKAKAEVDLLGCGRGRSDFGAAGQGPQPHWCLERRNTTADGQDPALLVACVVLGT